MAQQSSTIDPREWTRRMIKEYRHRARSLSQESIDRIRKSLSNFLPPCQVAWITTSEPWTQIVVVTHPDSPKGDETFSYRPLAFEKVPTDIEEILSSSPFDRLLSPSETSKYYVQQDQELRLRDLVEIHLLNLVDNPPSATAVCRFHRNNPLLTSRGRLTTSGFVWQILGDITSLDPVSFAIKLIEEVLNPSSDQSVGEKPDKIKNGYCAYFYPPVWIENQHDSSFEEKTVWGRRKRADQVVLDTTYKSNTLFVKTGGLLAIDCDAKEQALIFFNEIMMGAVFHGLSAHVLHDPEIGMAKLNLTKRNTGMMELSLVSPRQQQLNPMTAFNSYGLREYQEISENQMSEVLVEAELYSKVLPQQWIYWYLQAKTHYENFEFNQAFLTLWTIVEQDISERWQNTVSGLSKRRRDKFKRPEYWSADRSLEILNLRGGVDQRQYNKLMNHKNVRNRIVHELGSVDQTVVEDLLVYVTDLLQSKA